MFRSIWMWIALCTLICNWLNHNVNHWLIYLIIVHNIYIKFKDILSHPRNLSERMSYVESPLEILKNAPMKVFWWSTRERYNTDVITIPCQLCESNNVTLGACFVTNKIHTPRYSASALIWDNVDWRLDNQDCKLSLRNTQDQGGSARMWPTSSLYIGVRDQRWSGWWIIV